MELMRFFSSMINCSFIVSISDLYDTQRINTIRIDQKCVGIKDLSHF